MTLTVYSKAACHQCDATKRQLDKRQVPYTCVDLEAPESAAIFADLVNRGFTAAPVVILTDADGNELDAWAGYRPDRLDKAAALLPAAAAA